MYHYLTPAVKLLVENLRSLSLKMKLADGATSRDTEIIDAGLSKKDCLEMLHQSQIRPPEIYSLGFKNANCVGCVKATSPAYWDLVRRAFPDVFLDRAEQSKRLGVKLARVKGVRTFLDDLPVNSAGLVEATPDCGIFCEERP